MGAGKGKTRRLNTVSPSYSRLVEIVDKDGNVVGHKEVMLKHSGGTNAVATNNANDNKQEFELRIMFDVYCAWAR